MSQGINWNFLPYNDEERKLAELEQLQEANARIPEIREAQLMRKLNDASFKMLGTPEAIAAGQAKRDDPRRSGVRHHLLQASRHGRDLHRSLHARHSFPR